MQCVYCIMETIVAVEGMDKFKWYEMFKECLDGSSMHVLL